MKASLYVFVFLSFLTYAGEAFPREWTDSTGQYKTEAEFIELVDDAVRLQRSDGHVVDVPLELLSVADQQFVRELVASNAETENVPSGDTEDEEPGKADLILATCLKNTVVTHFAFEPGLELMQDGELIEGLHDRYMEVWQELDASITARGWGPDYSGTAKRAVLELREVHTKLEQLGLTVVTQTDFKKIQEEFGPVDRTSTTTIQEESYTISGLYTDVEVTLHHWDWIAIGVDEYHRIRLIQIHCDKLLGIEEEEDSNTNEEEESTPLAENDES